MSDQDGRQAPAVSRPSTEDAEAWKAYWQAQGQPWRTEPEIDTKRQEELAQHRAVLPDIEKGIYPFKDLKLSRADIEWLLVTHENGRGPVDWSDESQRKRKGLDLRGADLSQENLSSLPLACMQGGPRWKSGYSPTEEQQNMAAVCMKGAYLGLAQLQGAYLREAQLQKAFLGGARLQRADLREAQLQRAFLGGAQLQGADLREARLQEADLRGAQLQGAFLREAQLQGADLRGARLQGADLGGAQLQKAYLGGAQLQGADLWGAQLQGAYLWEAQLQEANLGLAQLQGADLEGAQLQKAFLGGAQLQGADLGGAQLQEANLGRAQLQGAYLWEARLQEANLGGAQLQGAYLEGARLQGADLRRADLDGATLDKVALSDGTSSRPWLLRRAAFVATKLGHRNEPRGSSGQKSNGARPVLLQSLLHMAVTKVVAGFVSDEKYGSVRLADVRWGEINLTVVDWIPVKKLGDEHWAYQVNRPNGEKKDKIERLNDYREAVRANRQLAVVLHEQGLNEEADHFAYRAQRLQRIVSRKQKKYGRYLFSGFLDLLAGYGYRPLRSLFWYLVIIFVFALAYSTFGHLSLWPPDAFVYSLTSFHGRGFFPGLEGKHSLHDPLIMLAAFEAVVGLFIEISFIATFTQRFLRYL